ncbi:MAG: hypothetical protein QHJ73_09950, partial [Armatimonadota bacterium]|nr:hypothetical protein [Armatimonadota bacterium]
MTFTGCWWLKWVWPLVGAAMCVAVPAAAGPSGAEVQRLRLSLRSLIPEPGAGDTWRPAAAVRYFGPEELEAVAGQRTPLLRELGFRQGIEARFRDAKGETRLCCFDLGGVLHAFAAVDELTPKEARPLPLGRRGWQAGEEVVFCAGRYLATATGPAAASVAQRAAQSARAADQTENLFDWLPEKDRVPGSERALPKGLPDMPFLGGAAGATYRVRSKEAALLLFVFVTREESSAVFPRLEHHLQSQGRPLRRAPSVGEESAAADVKPLGPTVAMRVGRFIALASGTDDPETLRSVLTATAAALSRKAGGEPGLK